MEGHPGYEDRRATPARGPVGPSAVTRKQAFLLLDDERRSLAAHLRPAWRPRARYEDLSLVIMLARLERDWLGQRLADWAMPWGAAPRTKLETDIDHTADALKRLGRWLPMQTIAKAEGSARRRLAAITTGLQEPGSRVRTAVPAAPPGPAPDTPRFKPPWRARVAALAALLLLGTGTGALLLARSEQGRGPDSAGRAGAGAGMGASQHATNLQIPGKRDQGHPGRDPSRNAKARSGAGASPPGSAASTPVASEPSPAPPAPPLVTEPVTAAQATPTQAPSDPSAGQAKDAGGCPPEFGYEC